MLVVPINLALLSISNFYDQPIAMQWAFLCLNAASFKLKAMIKFLGLLLCCSGCVLLYLTHPNQTVLKQAVALYEMGRLDETYEYCQTELARNPSGEKAATLKFVAALTEAALGSSDEAEQHMDELANDYPSSNAGARALFWKASSEISRQDYADAKDVLQKLIERYSSSEYSEKARDLLTRLDKSLSRNSQSQK